MIYRETLRGNLGSEFRADSVESKCTAHIFSFRQVEAIVLAMISEAGSKATIGRNIDRENTTALMIGTNTQTVGFVAYTHSTLNIYLPTFLIVYLKSHTATGTSYQMATLGIEIHQQVFLQFLLNTRLRTVDDVLLRVVTGRVWALIDGYHTAIDRAELAEEVMSHLLVIKKLTVLTTVGVFSDAEVKHPSGISPQFIIARIERILQSEVTITVAIG